MIGVSACSKCSSGCDSNDFVNTILDDLSNFEKLGLQGREFFLRYDHQKTIERFGHVGLEHDDDYLYLNYMGDKCRVLRKTGEVEVADLDGDADNHGGNAVDGDSADSADNTHATIDFKSQDIKWTALLEPSPVLTIYDMLCHFQDFAPDATHHGSQPRKQPSCLCGQYCSVASLAVSGASPSVDTFSQEYADEFCGHTDQLEQALKKLGAKSEPAIARADITCTIPLFDWLDLMFQFWDGDDEFDAKIMFMWDKNILGFLHFETLYYVMIDVLAKLRANRA